MKSPSIIRRFIAEPLREQIWFAVKGIHPSQSSDRRLLETTIIPQSGRTALVRAGMLAELPAI